MLNLGQSRVVHQGQPAAVRASCLCVGRGWFSGMGFRGCIEMVFPPFSASCTSLLHLGECQKMSENADGTALHRGATCRQAESCARLAGRKGKSAAGGEGGGGLSRCLSSRQPINSWRDEPGDFETGAPQLVGLTQTTQSTELELAGASCSQWRSALQPPPPSSAHTKPHSALQS